jgi:hypothetical protein
MDGSTDRGLTKETEAAERHLAPFSLLSFGHYRSYGILPDHIVAN